MTDTNLSLQLTLGILTLTSITTECTSCLWLSSIESKKARAIAIMLSKMFPPVLAFSFLVQILSSAFEVGKEPWLLIPVFTASLLIIYLEGRSKGGASAELGDKHKTQGDLEELSLKVDSLEARVIVIEGRLQTPNGTSPSNQGTGSMADRPIIKDKASAFQGETNSGDTHAQAGGPTPDIVYSITEKGMKLVGFKQPKGKRGGGALHVKMTKVMYYFYISKGWFPIVDEGDEKEQKPDLEVWEPKTHIIRLEDGSLKVEPDPEEWAEKPFHVEVETTPRKSKAQVIENYMKARRLNRYVVFAVPTRQDLEDLRRILGEIGAPQDTYEVDDISDLLREYDEVRREAKGDEA
jgi:hypothetical protein